MFDSLRNDSLINVGWADELRSAKRYPVVLAASVRPGRGEGAAGSPTQEAHAGQVHVQRAAVDTLSVGGLSFLSPRPYWVGQSVWVRLRLGAATYEVPAAVRRRTERWAAGGRCYEHGVKFLDGVHAARLVPAIANLGDPPPACDGPADVMTVARELEWAEAYVQDHPACELGRLYLAMMRADAAAHPAPSPGRR